MTNDPHDRKSTKHPAFGHVSASRVSGHANLFMETYPQPHFMRLSIATGELHRSLAHEDVYHGPTIVEVWLSEVQWAQMIAGVGSSGTPCTLARYRDPQTGEFLTPKMPDDHAAKTATFKAEIEALARKATAEMREALKALDVVMEGKTIKKSDIAAARTRFQNAVNHLNSGIPFVAETANEAIHGAERKAEANLTAFVDHTMTKLGERALGDRLEKAIAEGTDLKLIGASVAGALTEKK